jgi:hypothetical protein
METSKKVQINTEFLIIPNITYYINKDTSQSWRGIVFCYY